jgi:hypothetical protein
MSYPRLTQALTVFHAWWEDHDMWDGNALYLDLDTAKVHAAFDYEGEEYGHWDDEAEAEDDEPRSRPEFTWMFEHGSWHLLDHGKGTLVQVSTTSVYRPSTEREVKQQDALAAAEKAERAARPHRPLAEELEAAAGSRTTAAAATP